MLEMVNLKVYKVYHFSCWNRRKERLSIFVAIINCGNTIIRRPSHRYIPLSLCKDYMFLCQSLKFVLVRKITLAASTYVPSKISLVSIVAVFARVKLLFIM